MTGCDTVVEGIKDGGGQCGGRCCITGGGAMLHSGEVTLTGGDKKWVLGGGDLDEISDLTSTSTDGADLLTSVSTE